MNTRNQTQPQPQQQPQQPAIASSKAREGRVAMVRIDITRAEGPLIGAGIPVGKTYSFTRWIDARNHLEQLCRSLDPKQPGYDKTDFVVIFADGMEYVDRYDAQHQDREHHEPTHLGQRIESFWHFYACHDEGRPAWMSNAQWQQHIDSASREYAADTAQALLTYDLRD